MKAAEEHSNLISTKSTKVFLDCGGNDGCSVRKFLRCFPDSDQYIIHSFEPNPVFKDCYSGFRNVIFHEEAVWVEDGEAAFYLSNSPKHQGSTLIHSKFTGNLDKENHLNVRCIDFSSWIKNNLNQSDYIILKMDIEGAEYEVLQKMMEDGTIRYIDQLYIEFHYEKITMPREIHDQLLNKLTQCSLGIKDWDALSF
jgi:FkbM family methyltransferase